MYRILFTAAFALMILSACNLKNDEEAAQVTPLFPTASLNIVTATPSPTLAVTPTATTANTNTSTGSSSGSQTRPNCTARTDWPIYTVVAGDTLGTIAQRVGSTVNELTTGNCLANANSIQVGQQLRVPRLPQTTTKPEVVYFRVIGLPVTDTQMDGRSLDWQTRGASQVQITQIPPSGTNGVVLGRYPASSTLQIPRLGTEYNPYATFYLYLLDSNGKEIKDASGNLVGAAVQVPYNNSNLSSFTANPNPVERGKAVTLNWSVPVANRISINLYNPATMRSETLVTNLGNSGSYTYVVPSDYAGQTMEFTLVETNNPSLARGILMVNLVAGSGCTVRSNWNSYTIQAGDSVEGLARLGGITPADLLLGNCWPNASFFTVGTTIRVPVMPYYNDQIAQDFRCGGVFVNGNGGPVISPATQILSHCYQVQPNSTVTVSWNNFPPNTVMLEFWHLSPNGNTDVIGTDNNLADGGSITYQVGSSMNGQVYVFAYASNSSVNSEQIAVFSE